MKLVNDSGDEPSWYINKNAKCRYAAAIPYVTNGTFVLHYSKIFYRHVTCLD